MPEHKKGPHRIRCPDTSSNPQHVILSYYQRTRDSDRFIHTKLCNDIVYALLLNFCNFWALRGMCAANSTPQYYGHISSITCQRSFIFECLVEQARFRDSVYSLHGRSSSLGAFARTIQVPAFSIERNYNDPTTLVREFQKKKKIFNQVKRIRRNLGQ